MAAAAQQEPEPTARPVVRVGKPVTPGGLAGRAMEAGAAEVTPAARGMAAAAVAAPLTNRPAAAAAASRAAAVEVPDVVRTPPAATAPRPEAVEP